MSLTIACLATIVFAQGPLTPPGAPGATMKTLDQLEPRIPIPGGSVSTTISTSGSYYLTGNLMRSITIAADNVTLDLMGFWILGVNGYHAITFLQGYGANTIIRNGTLRLSGNGGIALDARYADNCLFENLRVEGGSGAFWGIVAGIRSVVRNCTVRDCNKIGIHVGARSEVRDCRVFDGTVDGIHAENNCRIIDNVIEGHDGSGLTLLGTGSYVANNIVKGNDDNYDLAQGNQLNLLLCEIPETLDWPCSVKFAGTLKTTQTGVHGITVAADDVTIDMAGHTLIGPGADSRNGIYQNSSYRNLRVFNGKIVHWERSHVNAGIYVLGNSAILSDLQISTNAIGIKVNSNARISNCTVYGNSYYGIFASISGNIISDCTAYNNGSYGIYAYNGNTISGCTAYNNSSYGIDAPYGNTVSECAAYDNGNAGINAVSGNTISGCTAYGNDKEGIKTTFGNTIFTCTASQNESDGIYAYNGGSISDCVLKNNTRDGVRVDTDCQVTHCTVSGNGTGAGGGAGIRVTGGDNRIDSNTVTDNDRGISVNAAGNLIIRNSASDNNTLNWDVAAGNVCLVVQATTGGAISGNSGGAALGSTDPNANFTY